MSLHWMERWSSMTLILPRSARPTGRAVAAATVDVDREVHRREALRRGDSIERRVERALQLRRQRDIADGAALDADEVVMVLSEILGELVVRMIRAMHETTH